MRKVRSFCNSLDANLFLIAAVMGFAGIASESAAETAWELQANYTIGDIDGFLQTPAGGNPGTTTDKRPTLQELGIDSATALELKVRFSTKRHRFQLGTARMRHDATATLQEDLISQWQFFSAGSQVVADVQTDIWELNYLYRFPNTSLLGSPLEFRLGGGLTWFDFHYQLQDTGSRTHVDRKYSKVGYRAGGELVWSATDRIALQGRFWGGPAGFQYTPAVDCRHRGHLQPVDARTPGRADLGLVIGAGWRNLDYEDNQEVPNHISFEYAPHYRVGLQIRF